MQRRQRFLNELQSVPPLHTTLFSSVHPVARLAVLALPLIATLAPVNLFTLSALATMLASVYFALFKPRWIAFALFAPILLLSTIVALAMISLGEQPTQEVFRYVLTLIASAFAGYIFAFSSKLLELAAVVEGLLFPIRWVGRVVRTIVVTFIVAARFFIVLAASLSAVHKAFQARNIPLTGTKGIGLFAGALLLRALRAVDDVSVALLSRGTVLEKPSPLLYERYSIRKTSAFLVVLSLIAGGVLLGECI